MDEVDRAAIKKAIKAYTRIATKNRQTARDTLVREGIYRKDGTLSPEYRPAKKSA